MLGLQFGFQLPYHRVVATQHRMPRRHLALIEGPSGNHRSRLAEVLAPAMEWGGAIRATPISPQALERYLVTLVTRYPATAPVRVAIDAAPAAAPGALAQRLVGPLLGASRPALRIPTGGFLRAASLRLERGRLDPDSLYEDWFDRGALRREVLDPLGPGGSGQYLPALWDPVGDRSVRLPRVPAPAGAVVLVDGPFLLGTGLPFDLTVHLQVSPAALRRQTPTADAWTLPAYGRYEAEVHPTTLADVVVRMDDPHHPALVAQDR